MEKPLPDMLFTPQRTGSQITAFHVVVIGLSLVLTLAAWQFSKMQIETRTQQRFDVAAENTAALITTRMARYADALWAGVAIVQSHKGDMDFATWQAFAQSLELEQRYPGTNGIGIIHYHTADTLAPYLAKQRETRPDFTLKPPHNFPFYMPITAIIPVEGNEAAVGLDIAHEHNRRTAAFSARSSGAAQITGPITLVQDAKHTPGFLFYAPFYAQGAVDTPAQRRARFKGAVYAPIIVDRLMEGLLSNNLRKVSFSLTDGSQTIYDEHTDKNPALDPDPMHQTKIPIALYGREWIMDIRSDLSFRAANTYSQPNFILLGGLIVEALIVALFVLMSRANAQAVRYAHLVSSKLRHKSQELAATVDTLHIKNAELEQFSYVASHDLKTPIRGISGLVEILKEDLEPYFASDLATPEVMQNLDQIERRVVHMRALTDGILAFSQTVPATNDAPPMRLVDAAAELRVDFDLAEDQLVLTSNVAHICHDPFNFRRVLDHLVGNAVKFHQGPDRLRITITVQDQGARCAVCVRDNGPGIGADYHEKVFDVFQTLDLPATPESTGIGLSIVKKAVEHHGGRVTLTSQFGDGAQFAFDWPQQPPARTAPEHHTKDAA